MRKILAVTVAAAFATVFFATPSHADECVEVKTTGHMYVWTPVGVYPVPGGVTVDPDPPACLSIVGGVQG